MVAKNIIHRHLVFSLPADLRSFIKENRMLQKIISDATCRTIKNVFSDIKRMNLTPGVIGVIHPFGKDIEFKPHVHCIVTEGGFSKDGKFISIGQYIPYNKFHKTWQYEVLTALKKYIPTEIIDSLFKKYPNGFCAYVKPERIYSSKRLIEYIGRYVRHPAIANSRIIDYNGLGVTFYYEDHSGNKNFKTMSVFDFILAIIQHIPDKHFRLIRYYGAYARKKKKAVRIFIQQSIIIDKTMPQINGKGEYHCSKCKEKIEIVFYCRKPPPKDRSKITSWIEMQRLS